MIDPAAASSGCDGSPATNATSLAKGIARPCDSAGLSNTATRLGQFPPSGKLLCRLSRMSGDHIERMCENMRYRCTLARRLHGPRRQASGARMEQGGSSCLAERMEQTPVLRVVLLLG